MKKALLLATAISLASTASAEPVRTSKMNPNQIAAATVSSRSYDSALTAEEILGIMTIISVFAILYGTHVGSLPVPLPIIVGPT